MSADIKKIVRNGEKLLMIVEKYVITYVIIVRDYCK